MIVPEAVRPGDTLRLIAVSGCVHEGDQTQTVAHAREKLEALGFSVIVDESCHARYGYLTGTDAERAQALERAFLDPLSQGIVCLKGGYGCNRMVDLVHWDRVLAHPKAFLGFSDITTLHLAMNARGLVTFHGPMGTSVLPEAEARTSLLRALSGDTGDWLMPASGTQCVRAGCAEGTLIGGNLSLVAAACGTPYFPDMKGRILFLEEIGEYVYAIDRMLNQLRLCGVFDQIAGLILGAFTDCRGEYADSFSLGEVVENALKNTSCPVLAQVHAGHVAQSLTLPLGRTVRMDAAAGRVCVLP